MNLFRYIGRSTKKVEADVDDHDVGEADLKELISKAAGGDYKAFGKLYDIYLGRIYGYVYYHVRDKMASEDITQQVFIKVWEALGKYEQRDQRFSSWIFRIAHNHMIDYYRSTQRDSKLKNRIAIETDDPEQQVEDKFRQEEIMNALSTLTDQQRQVIILKFIEGFDNREIAEILGKNEGSIRITQMRALMALREKFSGEIDQ